MAIHQGPEILARTMSVATRRGKGSKPWQYHSRSDHHSKLICWTILFDLLQHCDAFQSDAAAGRVGIAVNHVLVGPINKTLDLVVCRIPRSDIGSRVGTFAELGVQLGVVLSSEEAATLRELPPIGRESSKVAAEVAIALEAKACMTAHVKSLPRLHAEILATGFLAKQAAPDCISVAHTLVNHAAYFVSPAAKHLRNDHKQPNDTQAVLQMLRSAIPLVRQGHKFGYDVIGASVIDCRNDGHAVETVEDAPAPGPDDFLRYDRMIASLCSAYRARFRG